MVVKAIGYEVRDLGKRIKKSKRHFAWRFEINGKPHRVDFTVSFISGKKKLISDGALLYEGKKVLTTTFQYPFTIEPDNMLLITQNGENFELRINNQVFSDIWNSARMMGYGYGYEKKSYDSGEYGGFEGSKYGGYEGKKYDAYGPSSYGGFGSDPKPSQSYQPKPSTSRVSGAWGDVDKAMKALKIDNSQQKSTLSKPKGDEFGGYSKHKEPSGFGEFNAKETGGFDHGFDKFEYKGKSDFGAPKRESVQKKEAEFTDFTHFDKPKKKEESGFTEFDNWGKPESKKQDAPPKNDFSDFSKIGQGQTTQPNAGQGSPQKQQALADLLDLDDAPTTTTTKPQQQQIQPQSDLGFDNAFGAGGGSNMQIQQQKSSDLMGFDFGGPTTITTNVNTSTPTQTNTTTSTGLDFFSDNPAPQQSTPINVQPQIQTQTQPIIQPQEQQTTTKKPGDLWNSNLVDLGDLTSIANQGLTNDTSPFSNQKGGYGGPQSGGYGGGNLGGYGGSNPNGGFGGNIGGGYGYGAGTGGFGGGSMSGYNNPGFNQGGGYGGNQNFGYGGQQPSYGYAGGYGGNPSGGFNTNMNVGGGFGMNTAQPVSTKTPFDF